MTVSIVNGFVVPKIQSLEISNDDIKKLGIKPEDFSKVDNICLNDIERLLDLQKIAVFNGVKLTVENMQPQVSRLFEQTGLYKLLSFGNSSIHAIRKRQGLAFD